MTAPQEVPTDSAQQTLKVLLIGDATVGKSSLLIRLCDSTFNKTYMSTIGIDFRVKYMEVDGNPVKVQVWDTAGQERFLSITKRFYRGAHGIFITFDVTRKETFNSVQKWAKIVEAETVNQPLPVVLIGNKCDLIARRVVDKAVAHSTAEQLHVPYFETSALTGENVEEAFTHVVREIMKNAQNLPKPAIETVQPEEAESGPQRSGCSC